MRQAFCTPEEISMIADRQNFKNSPDHITQVLINNLLLQISMHSAQAPPLASVKPQLVTSSERESVFKPHA